MNTRLTFQFFGMSFCLLSFAGCITLQPGDLDKVLDRIDQRFPVQTNPSPIPSASQSTRVIPRPSLQPSLQPVPAQSSRIIPTPEHLPGPSPSPNTVSIAPITMPSASITPGQTTILAPSIREAKLRTSISLKSLESPSSLTIWNGHAFVAFTSLGGKWVIRDIEISSGKFKDFVTEIDKSLQVSSLTVSDTEIWLGLNRAEESLYLLKSFDRTGKFLKGYILLGSESVLDLALDVTSGNVYLCTKIQGTPATSALRLEPLLVSDAGTATSIALRPLSRKIMLGTEMMTSDSTGNAYVYQTTGPAIHKISPDQRELLAFRVSGYPTSKDVLIPDDLAVDSRNGDVYLLGHSESLRQILRFNSQGHFIESLRAPELAQVTKLAIDVNGTLLALDPVAQVIFNFEPFY